MTYEPFREGDEESRSERKTTIVATLGPSCSDVETVRRMIEAGMDVARVNFSHGDEDDHRAAVDRVREAAEETGRAVAVLQDIQGPKIRVGSFPGGRVELETDEEVLLEPGDGRGGNGVVPVDYDDLLADVAVGDRVVLADGRLRLEVVGRSGDRLRALVRVGGALGDHKGVAFPDSRLSTPAVTDKDRADLALGRELRVDFVAASFVRTGDDVRMVQELAGEDVPVVAKIELAAGYANLDEILQVSHGAMVARGDLGVELPLERIPLVQMDILSRTNGAGAVSITATEMLESMTTATRPTRAEVTDVASAVFSGTDAVMLSGETAVGRHPVRVVEVMDVIVREIEGSLGEERRAAGVLGENAFPSATAKAAVEAAAGLDLETIVAFTESGSTARLLSKYRPEARIVAFTPEPRTYRRMALYRGVKPLEFERRESTDEMIAYAERVLVERGICREGDRVVMVAGVPPNERHSTNLMKLHRIGLSRGG